MASHCGFPNRESEYKFALIAKVDCDCSYQCGSDS